jgi:hypothetical protein
MLAAAVGLCCVTLQYSTHLDTSELTGRLVIDDSKATCKALQLYMSGTITTAIMYNDMHISSPALSCGHSQQYPAA